MLIVESPVIAVVKSWFRVELAENIFRTGFALEQGEDFPDCSLCVRKGYLTQ
jgi:hypothetical protein